MKCVYNENKSKITKIMRVGKHPITGENEIYLNDEEAEQMKEMVRGASLPHRRMFNVILKEL